MLIETVNTLLATAIKCVNVGEKFGIPVHLLLRSEEVDLAVLIQLTNSESYKSPKIYVWSIQLL
jgi:hypothetical protein